MAAFKLGKKVPRHDIRTLKFARYAAALSPPPVQAMWQGQVPSYPMDGNDAVGDCTVAGIAHVIENWTYNAQPPTPKVFSAQDCLNIYYALTGGPDTGLDLLTVLKQGQGAGFTWSGGVDTIAAYVELGVGNQLQAQQAVSLFGAVYMGVALPGFVTSALPTIVPWVTPAGGFVGENAPNAGDGHCAPIVGYDAEQAYIVTWGQVVAMDWGFYQACSDEGYAVLSPDWIGAGKSPGGFNMQQLTSDLAEVEQ